MEINKTVHNLRFLANQTSSEFNEVRVDLTMLDAANIILNQKKELERFEKIETTVNEFWCVLQKFSKEKFKETPTLEELLEYIEQAKAKAIKEFAERLLEAIREHHYLLSDHCNSRDYGMFTIGIEQAIGETKKEMVGDANIATTTETEGDAK